MPTSVVKPGSLSRNAIPLSLTLAPALRGRGEGARALLLLATLASAAAHAQDGGTPSLLDQLDAAAGGPAATSAPAPAPNFLVRAFQSLNPDLSVILDLAGGWAERAPLRLAGDDPDLKGDAAHPGAGFTVQEAEFGFSAVVDPYFRGDVFLTIPNLEGLEVEEAMVTTTGLPWGLQVKAGAFRSAFGRQNGQHLHVQDFTRRPLVNAAYLGTDGLKGPGLQLSWLAPLPFFLQLDVEAFSLAPPDSLDQPTSFGGGARTDFTWAAELKAFAPLSDALSVAGGLSFATGLSPGLTGRPELEGARSWLYGADLMVKYKPPNQAGGYFALTWTTEYLVRKLGREVDGGVYTQLVAQVARRWSVGLREDVLGLPASSLQPLTSRTSASVSFIASEFARLRAYVEREFTHDPAIPDSLGAYLVLEVSLGAHGAHAF